jgi:hypothetical protein
MARRSAVALAVWVICCSCLLAGLTLWIQGEAGPTLMSGMQARGGGLAIAVAYVLTWLEVCLVGALIVSRQMRNPIGWLALGWSSFASLQGLANGYSAWAVGNDQLSDWRAVAWFGSWIGAPGLGLVVVALLVFPTGRFLFTWSPVVALLAIVGSVMQAAAFALQPGPLRALPTVANPVLIAEPIGPAVPLVRDSATGALTLSMLISALLLAERLRRATGKERQQLKWIAYSAVLFALGVGALSFAPSELTAVAAGLFAVTGAGLTTAIGVAILKYQLFDVDVLINRTLIYGALIITLTAIYAGAIVLLEIVLSPITRGSEIAIAASTLGVAALSGPALRRIREAVDRRFYRRRYDAERALAAFSTRLGDEVDLASLTADLLGVVHETMQPTNALLWVWDPDTRSLRATNGTPQDH